MRQRDQVSAGFADRALACSDHRPGPGRVQACEALLARAQSNGSFAEEFVAREHLAEALSDLPDDARLFDHVQWLRAALDSPERLDAADRENVLEGLLSALDQMLRMPGVPLETIRAALADAGAVLAREGFSVRPVHGYRARLAAETGDLDGLRRHLHAWLDATRDELSDCEACEAREQGDLMALLDPARALELLEPVTSEGLGCDREPALALGAAALIHLRRGEVDEAVQAFRRGWPLVRESPDSAVGAARLLVVLTRLGNPERAVDLLGSRLDWLDEIVDAPGRLEFGAAGALVVLAARARGVAPDELGGRTSIEQATSLAGEAVRIAGEFDARNGSTTASDRVVDLLDLGQVADAPTLPPTRLPARPGNGPAPGLPFASISERASRARVGLRELATDLDDLAADWLRDREALIPGATDEDWAAIALLDRMSAQDAGPSEHRQLLESALAAAERAGDEGQYHRARGELAVLDTHEGTTFPDVGEATLTPEGARARGRAIAIAEHLETLEEDEEAAGLWRRIAWFGSVGRVGPEILRAADAYGRAGLPLREAMCHVEAAMQEAPTDPPAALDRLDQLEGSAVEHPRVRAILLDARSRILEGTGDPVGAAAAIDATLRLGELPANLVVGAQIRRADLAVATQDWPTLERVGAQLTEAATTQSDGRLLALAQRFLGLACVETGRVVEAAELLEAAVPVLELQDQALVGPAGWALGHALSATGDPGGARHAFDAAGRSFNADGRWHEAAHAHLRAAHAAWECGHSADAAMSFEGAAYAAATAGTVDVFAAARRGRSSLLIQQGRVEEGIAALDSVLPEALALAHRHHRDPLGLDSPDARAGILRQGAQLLAEQGATDAAIDRLVEAEALVDPSTATVLRAERLALLADADRLLESEADLRATLEILDEDEAHTPARLVAASALAQALERTGRINDAHDVWQEYGPRD